MCGFAASLHTARARLLWSNVTTFILRAAFQTKENAKATRMTRNGHRTLINDPYQNSRPTPPALALCADWQGDAVHLSQTLCSVQTFAVRRGLQPFKANTRQVFRDLIGIESGHIGFAHRRHCLGIHVVRRRHTAWAELELIDIREGKFAPPSAAARHGTQSRQIRLTRQVYCDAKPREEGSFVPSERGPGQCGGQILIGEVGSNEVHRLRKQDTAFPNALIFNVCVAG